jgi:hypothetical protein
MAGTITPSAEISREKLIDLLNEDLAREYQGSGQKLLEQL